MVAVFGNCSLKVHVFLHLTGQEPITWKSSNVAIFYSPMKNKFVQLWSKNYGAFPFLFVFFVFFDTWTSWYIINNNNLLTESEGSTGKYPTEVLLYWPSDIQQDRGWIFSRTARTVEVSKFYIIWHCTFVKNGRKGHARAKYKFRNSLPKKYNCKKCSLVSKTALQWFLYRILTQFG
jgi:hypothetical protein